MLAQEIIRRKRDGHALDNEEIAFFITGVTNSEITDAQAAAFAMAVFHHGMTARETAQLTLAMASSGVTLNWSMTADAGPLLDKHSTGGVGDKVSLILAPLLAACGARMPMVSGRGLGHTGGTLDKLESIPGYQVRVEHSRLRRVIEQVGCAIIGADEKIAPADRRLYAIRDVTATVDSLPLITASILSKKLAAGVQALVMDVKTGTGAFAVSLESAQTLATSLVDVGNNAGLPTVALLTDMNQVLGASAGNALEVREAIDFLTGDSRDVRLEALILALGREALLQGGLARDGHEAEGRLVSRLGTGAAADRFQRMVFELGGPKDLIHVPERYLRAANVVAPVYPHQSGFVDSMDVRAIGMAVVELGGGRRRADQSIDHSVGFSKFCSLGQHIEPGTPLAFVHAATESGAECAAAQLLEATSMATDRSSSGDVVCGRVEHRH